MERMTGADDYTHDCETAPSDSYWVCLTPRCHHRSTFNVSDPQLAMSNAIAHMRKTGHTTSVTTSMRTVSVFAPIEVETPAAKAG